MPHLHPARCAQRLTASASNALFRPLAFRRSFSSTRSAAGSHESHYDPPTGWLFGVAPGQKYQKEGWETIWVWGFFGSLGLGAIAYCYKPDTSIQTWALEEARRRLEAEGILTDPGLKSGEESAQNTE